MSLSSLTFPKFDGDRKVFKSWFSDVADSMKRIGASYNHFGALGFVLPDDEYLAMYKARPELTARAFHLFASPGLSEARGSKVTFTEWKHMYDLHKEQFDQLEAITQALVAALGANVKTHLQDDNGLITMSLKAIFAKLKEKYGQLTDSELTAKMEQLDVPFSESDDMETFIAEHRNIHVALKANGAGLEQFH